MSAVIPSVRLLPCFTSAPRRMRASASSALHGRHSPSTRQSTQSPPAGTGPPGAPFESSSRNRGSTSPSSSPKHVRAPAAATAPKTSRPLLSRASTSAPASTMRRARSKRPRSQAMRRAQLPSSVRQLSSTPWNTNLSATLYMRAFLAAAARAAIRGVVPSEARASASAPSSRSRSAAATSAFAQARNSGVWPSLSRPSSCRALSRRVHRATTGLPAVPLIVVMLRNTTAWWCSIVRTS